MHEEATKLAVAWLRREQEFGLELLPIRNPVAARPVETVPASPNRSVATDVAPATERSTPQVGRPTAGSAAGTVSGQASRATVSLEALMEEPSIREAVDLTSLREALGDCQRCKLCSGRTNIVFGVGNPSARLMFIGEGPGEDEDREGVPFVGKAGRLLTDIIEKGMRLQREDVYIANVVKCRPPGNRNPEPDEIVACEPFLRRQIELVRPEVVVTLGTFATQAVLRNRVPISRQRGTWAEYRGVAVMPTFHPAYLLRTPSGKREVWADIQQVMRRLGLELPPRGA
jgi:uracil-DNA glycosylase family 4